jgi:hypothetical protein
VVNKAVVAAAPPADAKKGKDDKSKPAHPEYVYQDVSFITLTPPASATEPYRISRAFAVAAGEYDVYVALKERLPVDAKDREKTPTKGGVVKQTITVPNFWSEELSTSSIIVADKVEALSVPLTQRGGRTALYARDDPDLPVGQHVLEEERDLMCSSSQPRSARRSRAW